MLYRIVKVMITLAARIFYRHIEFTGGEWVPAEGPAIIIANHQSSLMDAALLGILINRPCYFFTRGDLFENRIVRRIFSALHMMPVHNHSEGRGTLDWNADSFNEAEQILLGGGLIVFFPEGSSAIEYRLKPFRKGAFRLALDALAKMKNDLDIPIIPAGINYTHPTQFQESVVVHFGTPISTRLFLSKGERDSRSLLQLSTQSAIRMKDWVWHVEEPGDECVVRLLMEISFNSEKRNQKWLSSSHSAFKKGKFICEKLNGLSDKERAKIRSKCDEYRNQLNTLECGDLALAHSYTFRKTDVLLLAIGWPFYLLCFLLNMPPLLLARRIAEKYVYRVDYFAWIWVVTGLFLYLTWFLLLTFLGFFWKWKLGFIIFFLVPASGLYLYRYRKKIVEWKLGRQQKKQEERKEIFMNCRQQREWLLNWTNH